MPFEPRIYDGEIIIDDNNCHQFYEPVVGGERRMRGLRPRSFRANPFGSLPYARPFNLPLVPQTEWEARLKEQMEAKAQLSDLRNEGMDGKPIPSRDQDGKGYCWAHSSTSCCLLARAAAGMPYVDLSAYAVACIIKGYRDEGGWCGESMEFIAARGVPTSEFWPQQSMSRSNDRPETWENARLHIVIDWMDLDPANMKAQLITALLNGYCVASDFNWWGHSVCTMDLVSLSPLRTRIWNSWGDGWSSNGTGVLEGSKAVPNNAIALRVVRASLASTRTPCIAQAC